MELHGLQLLCDADSFQALIGPFHLLKIPYFLFKRIFLHFLHLSIPDTSRSQLGCTGKSDSEKIVHFPPYTAFTHLSLPPI